MPFPTARTFALLFSFAFTFVGTLTLRAHDACADSTAHSASGDDDRSSDNSNDDSTGRQVNDGLNKINDQLKCMNKCQQAQSSCSVACPNGNKGLSCRAACLN